jgi:hypothetical protein
MPMLGGIVPLNHNDHCRVLLVKEIAPRQRAPRGTADGKPAFCGTVASTADLGKQVDERALARGLRDAAWFNNVLQDQQTKFDRLADGLSRRDGVQFKSSRFEVVPRSVRRDTQYNRYLARAFAKGDPTQTFDLSGRQVRPILTENFADDATVHTVRDLHKDGVTRTFESLPLLL